MLDRIGSLVRRWTQWSGAGGETLPVFEDGDHRVAAAALLVHAARVDGTRSPAETERLTTLLRDRFELDDGSTRALIAAAERRDDEAVDLIAFTDVVKRASGVEERAGLVEMLWEVSFADGEVHAFEDDLVWRVAQLLAVPSRDRIAIRRRVAERVADRVAEQAG